MMVRLLILPALLALAGCVTDGNSAVATAPAGAASGPTNLRIMRASEYMAAADAAAVELNGIRIANLGNGETYSGSVPPGPAIVKVTSSLSPGESSYRFTVEPGKTYRFTVSPRGSHIVAGLAGGLLGQALEGGGTFDIRLAN